MKKTFLLIGCLISLSLAAENPAMQAHVCQVDNFLAGCTVFPRAEGDQTGVPVDVGGTTYDLYLSWGTPAEFAYTDSVAVGGTYIFNCQVLTEAGTYSETLTKADGCDSIVTLTLTEYVPCSPVEFAYTDSIAKGGTYIFNCQVLTAPGTYSETLTKADGCDSIVTLTLTEYIPCSPVEFSYTDSMATGGTYIFNCQVLTEAGTYSETLTKADGCDSIVTLTLTEYVPCSPVEFSYTDSMATGGTYIFNCQVLTAPGTYSETLTKADGCDSIVTLTLTEYVPCSPVEFAYTDSMATGGTYIFNCQVLTEAGTYSETLTKADGCDSIVTLTLTEYVPCSPVEFSYTDSMATGGTYIFNCQVLTAPGTYSETLTKADGCDSIVTLTLTEYVPCSPVEFSYTDSMATGGTYIFNCQVLTEAGTYSETLTKADGCDSTVTLTLTEYVPCVPTTGDTTAYVCQGDDFYWHGAIAVDGATWTTTNVAGCDSVVTLHIIDLLPTTGDTTAYVCQGDDFYWHGAIAVDGATWTTTNVAGCDSVVTLHIIDLLPTTGDTTAYVCQGDDFYWHGAIAVDGATWTTTNVAGCDSVVTLHIIDLLPTTGDTTAYVCQGDDFYWHGAIAVDGATWTTTNVAGCDSVVTLHIIDLLPTTGDTTAYVCQGDDFYWHGAIAVDGATWTTTNAAGCDSVVTLHIIDLLPTTGDTTAYVCQGDDFYWHGAIAVDGATWTTTNVAGCDSVVTLHIIDLLPTTGDTTATICKGETFEWHGQPGIEGATWTTTNVAGCDSVVTLHVVENSRYLDSLPALVKDDSWLLMIHRRSIVEDYGINFSADQVHWYKVVGEVDEYPYGEDNDTKVGTGDYYTVASKMSGQYYALIDVDVTWKASCALYARTVILDCDNPQPVGPVLSPTYVSPGGLMRLTNLAQGETQLNVFTPAGQLIRTERVLNETEHELRAEGVCGFYLLQVNNDGQKYVFKYVVTQ